MGLLVVGVAVAVPLLWPAQKAAAITCPPQYDPGYNNTKCVYYQSATCPAPGHYVEPTADESAGHCEADPTSTDDPIYNPPPMTATYQGDGSILVQGGNLVRGVTLTKNADGSYSAVDPDGGNLASAWGKGPADTDYNINGGTCYYLTYVTIDPANKNSGTIRFEYTDAPFGANPQDRCRPGGEIGGGQITINNEGNGPAPDPANGTCRVIKTANGQEIGGTYENGKCSWLKSYFKGMTNLDEFGCAPGTRTDPVDGTKCVDQVILNDGDPDPCIVPHDTPFRWIACPLTLAGRTIINILDRYIYSLLRYPTASVFGELYGSYGEPAYLPGDANAANNQKTSAAFHTAWGTFRSIALGLVVIAGLVMIVSESIGMQIVDAYTVRKVLPRLLIAAILIAISWPLMYFLTTIFNDLGTTLGSILNDVTAGLPQGTDRGVGIAGNFFLAAGTAAVAIAVLGPMGILSLVFTAILALALGVVILILRETVITMAVIISPIAIAAYVLPNTAKFTSFWWGTLIKALMLFPIVSVFIAMGSLMSAVIGSSGNVGAAFLSFIVYFLPYFMLPFTLKFAGGMVATIGGALTSKASGGFAGLKKYRAGQAEYNIGRMKTGERFNGRNALTRGFNSATMRAGTKNFGLGNRGKAALSERISMQAAAHAKSNAGIAAQFNDSLLRAQSYSSVTDARQHMADDFGMVEKEVAKLRQENPEMDVQEAQRRGRSIAQNKVEQAITAAKANGGFGHARQVYAAQQLAATGTGFDDVGQMAQTFARASNGREETVHDLVGNARGAAVKSGRIDLGGADHGVVADLVTDSMRNGNARPNDEAINKVLINAGMLSDNVSILRGKPTSTAQIAKAFASELQRNMDVVNNVDGTHASTDQERASVEAGKLAAKVRNMQGSTTFGHEVGTQAMYQGLDKPGAVDDSVGQAFGNPEVERNVRAVEQNRDNGAMRDAYQRQVHQRGGGRRQSGGGSGNSGNNGGGSGGSGNSGSDDGADVGAGAGRR